MHTRLDRMVTLTVVLSLTATAVQAAPDSKSTSEPRPDLTTNNPTGHAIPGTATRTPQAAGGQGNVSPNSTGAASARRSGDGNGASR
jgi:hypothetical protein